MRETEETARFLGHILEIDEAKRLADDVEQIAMVAGGGVGPFPGRTFGGVPEPDIEGAAGAVLRVPDLPVIACPPTGGQVFAADRLGLAAEAMRQF